MIAPHDADVLPGVDRGMAKRVGPVLLHLAEGDGRDDGREVTHRHMDLVALQKQAVA